jgi:serine/threonine-protein kinase RsbW
MASIQLKIISDPANLASVREAIESLCANGGFNAESVGEIGLCVNEAMANVIRHAYNGATDRPIEISAQLDARHVAIEIRDWGNGVNPAELPPKEPDPMTPGGLGLVCLRQMMDETYFQPQPDGMLLTMKRRKDHKTSTV